MHQQEPPPAVSIIGRKNSGKTKLLVALAAELGRRGLRVGSIKHGHPHFEVDKPGSDSYRHVHEGGVGAVLLASAAKLAFIEEVDDEVDPRLLLDRFFTGRGYDIVLVEGYKHGPFPKIEIFRRGVHERPIHDPENEEAAASFVAIVTDEPALDAACPIFPLDGPEGRNVQRLADHILSDRDDPSGSNSDNPGDGAVDDPSRSSDDAVDGDGAVSAPAARARAR